MQCSKVQYKVQYEVQYCTVPVSTADAAAGCRSNIYAIAKCNGAIVEDIAKTTGAESVVMHGITSDST